MNAREYWGRKEGRIVLSYDVQYFFFVRIGESRKIMKSPVKNENNQNFRTKKNHGDDVKTRTNFKFSITFCNLIFGF